MKVELTFATQLNTRTLHIKQLNIEYKAFLWKKKIIKKKKTTLSTSFIIKPKIYAKILNATNKLNVLKSFFFLNNTFFLISKRFLLKYIF